MQFDWDDGNIAKCQKHGMTIPEIGAFFLARPRVAPDPAHSVTEQWHIAVGRTTGGRPAFVAFCWRGGKIRPVSARYMHEREARSYDTSPEDDHG